MNTQLEPMADEGYDRLEELLDANCVMNLEMLDGFFAALIAGPRCGVPSDYLPEVWGGGKTFENAFESQDDLREFIELVLRHWNSTAEILENEKIFAPLLKEDLEVADAHDWASGFMHGIKMHSDEWKPFLDDDEKAGPMVPIFNLFHQYSTIPSMKPFVEAAAPEKRMNLIVNAAAGVMQIKRHFSKKKEITTPEGTFRRQEPKVGRNDPCPCGSGLKLKKCCKK
ncbi:MAG: UPF0149 family protein [Methyloligellaceae bacterium]